MGTIQGVIFDIDGTLLNSNDAHARSWVDAFADFGWEMSYFRIKWLIGMGGDKLLGTLIPSVTPEEGFGKVVSDRRKTIFLEQYAPHLQPTPGSRAFVRRLKDDCLKLVIATSAKSAELETLLKKAEVEDLFEQATTASDVEQSKPDPDVVHSAMEKLGLDPESVLMVGDTPYDIESAQKAGVEVVAVRTGGWADDSLKDAIAVYDSPADILTHFDQSPFGSRVTAKV